MKRQPQNSDPIKQHFIPKAYLKHFCDQYGHIHIFDLKKKTTRHCKPEQTAFEKHLYTFVVNGHQDFGIEKFFCDLEGTYATHIRTISSGRYDQINSNDYKDILQFMAFLYARNPSKVNRASEIEHDRQSFMGESSSIAASDSVQRGAMSMMLTIAICRVILATALFDSSVSCADRSAFIPISLGKCEARSTASPLSSAIAARYSVLSPSIFSLSFIPSPMLNIVIHTLQNWGGNTETKGE